MLTGTVWTMSLVNYAHLRDIAASEGGTWTTAVGPYRAAGRALRTGITVGVV